MTMLTSFSFAGGSRFDHWCLAGTVLRLGSPILIAIGVAAAIRLGLPRCSREDGLGPSSLGWDAVACRDAGSWRTEFLAAKAPPAPGYAPASGDTSIGAFLSERGAEPVSLDEERKLLGAGT